MDIWPVENLAFVQPGFQRDDRFPVEAEYPAKLSIHIVILAMETKSQPVEECHQFG